MGKIRLLPDAVVNQIAAGEVVERPASVVKELVENALDAQAERVVVRLAAGGRDLIQVEDDGCGMDAEDAMLALERHATSKIRDAQDLQHLTTLGFRGEALPSIAAVSQLTLETAPAPGEGTRVRVSFGRVLGQEPCGRPRGTTVTVEKLFARTPARRKFLRSEPTELRHVVEYLQSLAFAYPQVAVTLFHGGRRLVHLLPAPNREVRLRQMLPEASLTPFSAQRGAYTLEGYLMPPTPARQLVVVVNRRSLKDRLLSGTLARLLRSTHGEWQADLFLHLQLPTEEVDFNVHPSKTEVRFVNPGAVTAFLAEALTDALAAGRRAPRLTLATPPGPPLPQQPLQFAVGEGPPPHGQPWEPPVTAAPPKSWGRYLGQYRHTYLLVEREDGLALVDQHVAHERVLFEQLLREDGPTPRQALLLPEVVTVNPAVFLLVVEHVAELAQLGLEVEPLSGHTLRITSLPAAIPASQAPELLKGVLEDLAQGPNPGRSLREQVAASLACRAAVQKNTPLTALEAQRLLDDLARCQDPHRCPHGRPIALTVAHGEIERRIGRKG
ncbi:MAG: DNA mismatch repair endonuclease MutL [Thermoanaerobaculum sp.]|nr:DNA mismatch repair endonuclease MutL [Thermoanaerobaculum sp.]MDW7967762.1 DNA mismatch repair endonuclease MutL [Thermoanaerobaculum sp.]